MGQIRHHLVQQPEAGDNEAESQRQGDFARGVVLRGLFRLHDYQQTGGGWAAALRRKSRPEPKVCRRERVSRDSTYGSTSECSRVAALT